MHSLSRVRAGTSGGVAAMAKVLVLTLGVVVGPGAVAHDDHSDPAIGADDTVPGENVDFEAGFDIASAYFYRGIPQENQGVVTQPWADLGFGIFESDGPITSLGLNFGTWNSLHDNTPGNPWYESDFYAALALGLAGGLEFGLGYTYLYGPNLGDKFSEEVSVSLALDDSQFYPDDFPISLSPSVNFIFEVEAGSDGLGGDGNEGTLVELGIEPGFGIPIATGSGEYEVGVSFPIILGLNIDDYYETASGEDDDHTFGYLDLPVLLDFPLTFVPIRYGTWSFGGGVHFLFIGDSPREIGKTDFGVTAGGNFEVYTSWGVTIAY